MKTPPGAYTGAFLGQHGDAIGADAAGTAAAAAVADWKRAAASAARVQAGALHLHHHVIRDALADGLDWHDVGELLGMHPQAAFEQFANLADATDTPARQRPALAITCTAGLAAVHDMERSGTASTSRTWTTATASAPTPPWPGCGRPPRLLGQDIWITVKLPGEYEGDDDLDDGTVVRRGGGRRGPPPRRARVAARGPGPQRRRRGPRRRSE